MQEPGFPRGAHRECYIPVALRVLEERMFLEKLVREIARDRRIDTVATTRCACLYVRTKGETKFCGTYVDIHRDSRDT